MKEAVSALAEENCMTVSGYITSLIVGDALENKESLIVSLSKGGDGLLTH